MHTLPEILSHVQESQPFKDFHAKDPHAFLAHIFIAQDETALRDIQVGYYDPARKLMTTFALTNDAITVLPDLEVFQKPGSDILPLAITGIQPDWNSMLTKARETQHTLYPGNVITKNILILQHLPIGEVFNISFITRAFKIINLKFNAHTGNLIKHHMDSILTVIK